MPTASQAGDHEFGRLAGMEIAAAQRLWEPEPGWLDTATYGLPPRPAWVAMQSALEDWRVGRGEWREWNDVTGRARATFARLVGVDAADVAVGAQASQLFGPVAASVADGARVLVAEEEFASTLFPWLAQADRLAVTMVPTTAALVDAIEPSTDVIAFSLVQSSNGAVAPYRQIVEAGRAADAMVVVDATQACGWFPFDGGLADVVVASAYKWLMSPRGTAFAYLGPAVRDRMRPIAAGWYAGEDPHASYYGPPLRLARSARRFDISPAWFGWIATAPTLEVIEEIGIDAIHDHNVALANRFLAGLGRPPRDSAIVTVDVPDAEARLRRAGVRAAVRAGRVRASFHVYTTEADVDLAVDALVG
jgi:selenocysteine lyase/cysteine desulfurase